MSGNSRIKILSVSDIHLGVPRIDPHTIPTNIRKVIYPLIDDSLDLLVIAGDFYDGPLDMSGVFSYEALKIIQELVGLAERYDFVIRILQGTYTHDRGQNQFFKLFGDSRIRLVEILDIEIIEHLGISILYKPDSLPCRNIMPRIHEVMKQYSLDKVDIMVNHGYFEHLLPAGIPHTPANTLKAVEVMELVNGVVLNGHVHTAGVYRNVINNGSFDRLRHGEEEAKGLYMVEYCPTTHKAIYEFVENPYACTFATIDVSRHEPDMDACKKHAEACMDAIMHECISTSPTKFIRIEANDVVIRQTIVSHVTKGYGNLSISSKEKNKKDPSMEVLETKGAGDLPLITESNLAGMLGELLKDRGTPLDASYIEEALK